MRLIHTSDWHLGQELHTFDRRLEHQSFLDWLAALLATRGADALLVSGDVFDSVNPPVGAQRQLYSFLKRISESCPSLQVVIVGGNHDSAARIELPAPLLDERRITLVGGMPRREGQLDPASILTVLRDADGTPRACCGAVPYLRPGDLPPVDDGESPTRVLYRLVALEAGRRHPDLPLILMGHLHVAGTSISELSERRIVVGGEEAVPADVFPDTVAYTALGHLHRPQAVGGSGRIRYSGAPFPMSISELDVEHVVLEVDLEPGGVAVTPIPIPRPVAFVRVPRAGALAPDALIAALEALPGDDPGADLRPYLEVAVAVDTPVPDLRERVDAVVRTKPYRLTRIARHSAGDGNAGAAPEPEAGAALRELRPEAVFALCHQRECGTSPSEELRHAFLELLTEVQSGQETSA